jgi:predicted NBD/HSP70 family sugar kinase
LPKEGFMREARDLLLPADGQRELSRKKMIIEVMIKSDQQSRLARRLGVSQAHVSTTVRELHKEGIVENDSVGRGRGGGAKVRLCSLRGVAIGVDLGFNHITVVARRVDQAHDRLCIRVRDDGANTGWGRLLPVVRSMIVEAVDETGQRVEDVVSAGIAVPRMIDPRDGRFTTPVLPPWGVDDKPAEDLARILGVHVAIDNDANLGAMAEQIYGLEEPIETVVYVKASTGVGAGIMIGHTLLRGQRGMAGEIGHLMLDRDGAVCMCGGRGCLDTIVGAEALTAQVRNAQRGNIVDLPTSLKSLVEKAHAGDAVCVRVLNDAGRTLGIALAQLCNLLNPHLVVLGGELATGRNLVLETCRQELRRYALSGAVGDTDGFQLRLSVLSPLAEAQGALILGLRSRQLEELGDAVQTPSF